MQQSARAEKKWLTHLKAHRSRTGVRIQGGQTGTVGCFVEPYNLPFWQRG
jgi:hypothetical protein